MALYNAFDTYPNINFTTLIHFGLFLSILISVFYLFLFLLSFSANIYDFPFNLKVYDAIFVKIVI